MTGGGVNVTEQTRRYIRERLSNTETFLCFFVTEMVIKLAAIGYSALLVNLAFTVCTGWGAWIVGGLGGFLFLTVYAGYGGFIDAFTSGGFGDAGSDERKP